MNSNFHQIYWSAFLAYCGLRTFKGIQQYCSILFAAVLALLVSHIPQV